MCLAPSSNRHRHSNNSLNYAKMTWLIVIDETSSLLPGATIGTVGRRKPFISWAT